MWQITTTFRNRSVVRFCENNGVDLNVFFFFPFPKMSTGKEIFERKAKRLKVQAGFLVKKSVCAC